MNISKTDTHTILTLHLSKDFKLPSFIQNESIQVIESILLQAQELFELQHSMHFKHSDDSLKSFYDKKVLDATLEAQKTYSSDLQCWQKERQQLSQEIARLQLVIQENLFQTSKSIELKNQEVTGKVLDATLQAQKSYSSELNRWQEERSQLSQEITRLQIDLQEKVHQASKGLESKNQELTGKLLAATSQISQLQDDRFDLEKRTRDFISKTLTDSFTSQIQNMKDAHSRDSKTLTDSFTTQLQSMKDSHSRDSKTLTDSFTTQLQSIKEAHFHDSETLKGVIQSYKLDIESYKIKYDDLLSQKTKTSTKLGQIGESSFEDLCCDAGIQVTNTAKEGYKADLIGVIGEHKIIIEVKNYTSTVNSKEVIKFKRDMDSNRECVLGLFVSMNTPIANISNSFHIDWLADKRPIVFISNMCLYDGKYLLEVVKSLIGVIQHYSVDEGDGNLQDKIERAVKSMEASINKLGNINKNIKLFRKQNNENMTSLEYLVDSLKVEVSNSLAVITGKLIEDDILETPREIAPVAPRKRAKKSTTSLTPPSGEHVA